MQVSFYIVETVFIVTMATKQFHKTAGIITFKQIGAMFREQRFTCFMKRANLFATY